MHNQTINLGIIGAGKVTTNPDRHIDSIRSLNDENVTIMAMADITPGLAKKVSEKFDIPYHFEDYHELLHMGEINAVAINTPTDTHRQIILDCLNAGKHVYVEKPITQTAQELEEVLGIARKSGKIFLGGSNGLLQAQMGMFKEMIDSGRMGEVYLVSVDRCSSRNQEYGKSTSTQKKGTGISSHSGSHNVEWALYLLGDPTPVSVQARGYYQTQSLSLSSRMHALDDDCCIATVYFDNGSMFLFKALRAAPAKDLYEMKLYGDKMTLSYDVLKCYKQKCNNCISFYEHNKVMGMQEITPSFSCGKTHADMYHHFFSCIREMKAPISNGERGLVTMKILDAISESIAKGGTQIILQEGTSYDTL